MRIDRFTQLNATTDSAQLTLGHYPLLINGRIRKGVVSPVRSHVEIECPDGLKQGIHALGRTLGVIVEGVVYWRDMYASSQFTALAGWTPLSAVSERIYSALVPLGSSTLKFTGTKASASDVEYQPISLPTPKCILITDGINKARIVDLDGQNRDAKGYTEWAPDQPEYVPIMIMPVMSGSSLYGVSPDFTKIYQSVAGRPLDFVINRTDAGAKGDADTTSTVVDFNPLSSIYPVSNGGLVASTLYQTYLLAPDLDRVFWGQALLNSTLGFPCGAVNHLSYADINGDLALITQTGIQKFNALLAQNYEHRITPFSATIVGLLNGTQTETATGFFDDYVLFALNTIYGEAVLVYDTSIEQWVSVDIFPGGVKQFVTMRVDGAQRLFYISKDDRLFEAYAGPTTATRRLYVGDVVDEEQHRLPMASIQYSNVKGNGIVKVTYFADGDAKETLYQPVTSGGLDVEVPVGLVPNAYSAQVSVQWKLGRNPIAHKSGILIEDTLDGDINNIALEVLPKGFDKVAQNGSSEDPTEHTYGIWSGSYMRFVPTTETLEIGAWYYILGSITFEGVTHVNEYFQATYANCTWTGDLFAYELTWNAFQQMMEQCDTILSVGRLTLSNDSTTYLNSVQRSSFPFVPVHSAMAREDNDFIKEFVELTQAHRYTKVQEAMLINQGYDSVDALVEVEGNAVGSIQHQFFTANPGWLALIGAPYIFDGVIQLPSLEWNWLRMGTKLLVSGRSVPSPRTTMNGVHYVELPRVYSTGTWLKIRKNAFEIRVETITPSRIQDPFTIYL